jgi:LysM repeat protein
MIPLDPVPITRAGREEPAVTTAGFTRINYRIQPGDTLAAIASQYGTTIRDLQSWNRLRNTRIAAGETLTILTSRQSGGVRTP